MEFVGILRVLSRRRLLVSLGGLCAVLLGLMLAFHGGAAAETTIASTRVLIDAPGDRAIDLGSEVSDTLALRAALLADLVTTDEAHAQIAQYAGMPRRRFAILGPSAGPPPLPITTAVKTADAARVPHEPYVLALLADGDSPIISITATGFHPAGEARLVAAAARSLDDIVARGRLVARRSLTTQRLGPVTVKQLPRKSRAPLALAAAAVAFALWCGMLVILPALFRLRHLTLTAETTPRAEGPGLLGR
jgi:hypothetical protein